MTDLTAQPHGAARIWAGGISLSLTLIVVALVVPQRGNPVQDLTGSAGWWYLARASGLVAWLLLGASVAVGLVMTTRLMPGAARAGTQSLHEFTGVLAVVFTALHLVSVYATSTLGIGLWQLLIPFSRPADPVAQGYGVLGGYLLATVAVTSWARAWLPWRWWHRLHLLSFPLFAVVCAHTVLAGSDITKPILQWAALVAGAVILFLVVLRLLTARPDRQPPAEPPGDRPEPHVPAPRLPPERASPATHPTAAGTGMSLLIGQTTWEADNIVSLRLHSPDGAALPEWEPGAHIELALPSGRRRQYSLCGDPQDRGSYRIAVLQVPAGRGGSVEVHTGARVGQLIPVAGPRNFFPLQPSPAYLLIAGGIGITAILAMAVRLSATRCDWKLVYIGRRRAGMAFVNEVRDLCPERVEVIASDEHGKPDLDTIIGEARADTAVYCCGSGRLLQAVRKRVEARPGLSLHSELFIGGSPTDGPAFHVELHRTGHVIGVPGDRSVLQAVREVLPSVPAGCEQGVCGACRTTVLAGEPDHRDNLLSNADRAAGAMLICVSRAHSERLTLDL